MAMREQEWLEEHRSKQALDEIDWPAVLDRLAKGMYYRSKEGPESPMLPEAQSLFPSDLFVAPESGEVKAVPLEDDPLLQALMLGSLKMWLRLRGLAASLGSPRRHLEPLAYWLEQWPNFPDPPPRLLPDELPEIPREFYDGKPGSDEEHDVPLFPGRP